jgi:hypothetical protein
VLTLLHADMQGCADLCTTSPPLLHTPSHSLCPCSLISSACNLIASLFRIYLQAAMLGRMKDEVSARAAELEAKQRAKMREWEREEEERRLKIQVGSSVAHGQGSVLL